jgi:protein involved in polysaccharide export with SLBB domain
MKFFIKLCVVCILSITNANAQSLEIEEILNQNPELSEAFEDISILNETSVESLRTNNGIPNATNAEVATAGDLNNQRDVKSLNSVKVKESDQRHQSILEKYFEIITGAKLQIYGATEFERETDQQLLFYNTVSKNYMLAPGDILDISFRGLQQLDSQYKINRDNDIIVSGLPPVNVNGLSIAQLEKVFVELLRLDDASAVVNISLDTARLITVQISGNADKPKTIAVPAYTPLSTVISHAGGVSSSGSLRNITLIENDGTRSTIDLYNYLQNPLISNDPLIASSARIFVGTKGATVAVSGFAARPGIYELAKGETKIYYEDLLKMAGSTLLPPGAIIEALSVNGDGLLESRKLTNGDYIYAGEALNIEFVETKNLNIVSVSGAVLEDFTLTTYEPISVATALRNGAVLNSNAVMEFAIIKGQNIPPKAINLLNALKDQNTKIPVGGSLYIFGENEYKNIVQEKNRIPEVVEVYIDNKRKAFLAPGTKLSDRLFRNLGDGKDNIIHYDLALIYDRTGLKNPVSVNVSLDKDIMLNENEIIQFFSKSYLGELIKEYPLNKTSQNIKNLKLSGVATIYIDGVLKKLLAPNGATYDHKDFKAELDDPNIYKLYSAHSKYDEINKKWLYSAVLTNTFNNKNVPLNIGRKDRYDLYTIDFIRNELFSNDQKDKMITSSKVDLDTPDFISLNSDISEREDLKEYLSRAENDKNEDSSEEVVSVKKDEIEVYNIKHIKQASRLVSGAVYFPGLYPIAGDVKLSEVLNQAGGLNQQANKNSILLSVIENIDGNLVLGRRENLNANVLENINIPESNSFSLFVNSLINNADVGSIRIEGEVQNPDNYRFQRSETLHDVIKRAGGFTEVAFPIGAIFTREKIKKQRQEYNQILAAKLESSILSISQIEVGNASTQISALLSLANRVRNIEVSGRMSVNAALKDKSVPVFLEDNDLIVIPKRPSHVSVIGAVGKETVAMYKSEKIVHDYLNDAGGLTSNANYKLSYILLPNGESQPIKKNTIVVPGSVLVIMPKTDKLSVLGLTTIISRIMGNIATSILAINNVK